MTVAGKERSAEETAKEAAGPRWVFDCDIDSEYDEYDGEDVKILDVSRSATDGDRVLVEFADGHSDWVGTDEVTDAGGRRYEDIYR